MPLTIPLSLSCALVAGPGGSDLAAEREVESTRPNVVLLMADDLGWGDVGYAGHPDLRTPHLDAMAAEGVRFTRFYSQAPVCSPTRGSCLTGRHPYRLGVRGANQGHLEASEITLAEVLGAAGYRTGHFGKWHLGTLTTVRVESNRGGPRGRAHFAPPWEHGFQTAFSTEAKVPTFDPMRHPETGAPYGTHYWTGPETMARDNLAGDDSRVIMDRALPFIESAVAEATPFLAVVWFHAPHLPVVAGPGRRRPYAHLAGARPDYYGCITALDAQVGRLRARLVELGVAESTMIWFCSDNGPEGRQESDARPGSTGGLRGRKRSLYEGGVRVPGLLVWPERFPAARVLDVPACTSDYLPTVLAATGLDRGADVPEPVDGVNLLPLIDAPARQRGHAIGFRAGSQRAWIDDRFKLIAPRGDAPWELYDLRLDAGERRDIAAEHAELVQSMRAAFERWDTGLLHRPDLDEGDDADDGA